MLDRLEWIGANDDVVVRGPPGVICHLAAMGFMSLKQPVKHCSGIIFIGARIVMFLMIMTVNAVKRYLMHVDEEHNPHD